MNESKTLIITRDVHLFRDAFLSPELLVLIRHYLITIWKAEVDHPLDEQPSLLVLDHPKHLLLSINGLLKS